MFISVALRCMPQEVLERHVGDLVAEDGGQHVVVQPEVEDAAGDEDLAARQGEGVGHRHVEELKVKGNFWNSVCCANS